MKRILFISYHTSPLSRLGVADAGGMNAYILQLSKALASMGWSIDIYTRASDLPNGKTVRGTAKSDVKKVTVQEVVKGFRVIALALGEVSRTPKQKLVSYVSSFANNMQSFITGHDLSYDVMHAHYYLSGLVAIKLKKTLSIPFVQTFHTLGIMKTLYGRKKETKRIALEQQIVDAADKFIIATELEKEELVKHHNAGKRKIAVIAPGVDHNTFRSRSKTKMRKKLGLPNDKKLVVFVGRIDPIKGITTLIIALGNLVQKYPDFRRKTKMLLIGGDVKNVDFWKTSEVKRIQNLIIEKDLDCCVEFVGAKPHNELSSYYSAADVVVLPSFYESFSLVTLEAMASGACVLASKVGGLQFLIENRKTGWLFENKNEKQLCQKLFQLLQNDKERKDLGKNAHEFSLQFSWEKQVEKVAGVYDFLINKNQSS